MRPWSTRAAAWLAAAALLVHPGIATASGIFDAQATLTFLGNVGGQQRYRFDYTLTNVAEPLGLSAFQVFFNSDPITQVPSGDKATLVSFSSPAGWGDVSVFPKNANGQWSINWDYDFVSPFGPLAMGNSLAGFSVVFDWNDPLVIPPIQHAQARNGSAHSSETEVTQLVGLVGALGGVVSVDCQGTPQAAGGITVQLLLEAAPYASTVTQADGSYSFSEIPLGTYTVVVIPPAGYGAQQDNHVVSLSYVDELVTTNFSLTCLLGTVSGTVTGFCDGQNAPLQGVTVDLFTVDQNGNDVLVGSVGTDASGQFSFPGIALGSYELHIVTPLGYTTASATQNVQLDSAGETVQVSFGLSCQSISAQPRTIGYWKHQVNVYLSGKGKAQESLAQMIHYSDELLVHFSENVVNPVTIYVPASSIPGDRLRRLEELLTVNRGGTMLDRAKQQLLALLLNVVSGKISQTEEISANGATVSQAITYANDLIVDGDPGNDETAKDIADIINNGGSVPSGMVPVNTRIITYDRLPELVPTELALGAAFPNPSRGPLTIGFAMPRSGEVSLRIYDVTGRVVRTLVAGAREAGVYQEVWDARDDQGVAASPGIYFSRLATADGVRSRRIALQ